MWLSDCTSTDSGYSRNARGKTRNTRRCPCSVAACGKERGIAVRVDKKRGKGSHQTLYFGDRKTIIRNPKDELKTGTYHAMLKQLGISEKDLK
jgi:mRNA interferase HicA